MASARDKDSPARTRLAISFQDNSDRDESTNSETSETDIPEPLELKKEKYSMRGNDSGYLAELSGEHAASIHTWQR
jgi:hypothetical protein